MRQTRTAVMSLSLMCLAMIFCALPLSGQMALTISDDTVSAGSPAQCAVTVDLSEAIFGFSFGARHDGAVLTPTAVSQGAATAATNAGAGADYFLTELAPTNGPGVIVACVFTLGSGLDSLPAGAGQEVALIDYSTSAGAAAGSTTNVTAATDLGSPPANIVFTITDGTSTFPTTTNGSVTFDVPPPSGTTCTLADPCACTHDISWTNGAAYTSVQVRVDGVLTQTLAGTATSTTLTSTGSATIAVRGVVGGSSSSDDTCTATCPVIVPAPIPSGFTCNVTSSDAVFGCTVDVSWTLEGTYTALELLVDGVVVSTLSGTATGDTVNLAVDAASQQICLQGTDECGDPLASSACCDVTCFPGVLFIRSDCNTDGGSDIGDPIFVLGVLFSGGGPATCLDACDMNGDGMIDISDPIFFLSTLFSSGANPPAPYPGCGVDADDTDPLDCQSFPGC